MSKRIVSFFLCFVMAFSLSLVPSSADYIGTPVTFFDRLLHWGINGADDVSPVLGALGQFSGFIYGTVCTGSDDGYHHADSISGCESGTDKDGQYAVAMCRYCGESFKVYGADLESAYNSYVTDLGFTEINSDGKLVWYPDIYAVRVQIGSEYGYFGDYPNAQVSPLTKYTAACANISDPVVTFKIVDNGWVERNTISLYVYYKGLAPIDGIYYTPTLYSGRLQILTQSNTNFDYPYSNLTPTYTSRQLMAGEQFDSSASHGRFTSSSGGWVYSGQVSLERPYVLIEPMGDIPVDSTSRPTTLIGDYGIIGDDGTIIHVEGDVIVDESNTTIYNPVTNVTNVFTDWAFDYSTRTYTLTLEDGSTVTVTYGNENITINEGDTIYNVYYILPSEDDPGAEPDAPGTDDGSGWAWLQGAWTQMMDKLSGILEAITGLELSPEINVDVEVGGDEQVTQESWFSDLLAKFGFLTSIHDIYTQLVADVTSDAATAAAVANGEVMLADVTNGHASVYAAERHGFYTAPELAISFGSSDKYGVDWANIRPLNLSWYAPHKETVDGILSGILWLSYLFLLIKRAPGIIRGAEMVTEDRINIYDWHMKNDP